MTTKSPTTNVRSREVIGVDQFSLRREVFDKHDTVFLPSPPRSPVSAMAYYDGQPIVTSNHDKIAANFKRNAPQYSSMRESRTEERNIEFRARKYSDNLTSELNQSDEVDYRRSMTERTRRLSQARKVFLDSNLHEPSSDNPFVRRTTRASMPGGSVIKYKIESPNLYKFPFAEPYATPPPVRKVLIDLGPTEVNGEKENQDPSTMTKHQSLLNQDFPKKINHQKLFEDLVKRYSPERKPIDWKLPPTRPRVVGSVPKSSSSVADSIDRNDKKVVEETLNKPEDDEVFIQRETIKRESPQVEIIENEKIKKPGNISLKQYGSISHSDEKINKEDYKDNDLKSLQTELDEKNDIVSELSVLSRQNKVMSKRPSIDKYTDLTIPALIEKITEEGDESESHKKENKVKRKRSFLDKLLRRKKGVE